MTEILKTLGCIAAAVLLTTAAWRSKPAAQSLTAVFDDQGQPFYPDFTDPLKAASLEVVEYNDQTGEVRPFKVEFRDGLWRIPSHHDYVVDAAERLAKTAAGVIDLRKDFIQTDDAAFHGKLGVVDPLDTASAAQAGIGSRVTLKDAAGAVQADFIIGEKIANKDGFRYIRLPGKKRVYGVKLDLELSTRFVDWIKTDLLELEGADLAEATILDYSVDEDSGVVDMKDEVRLTQKDKKWSMDKLPEGKKLDDSKVRMLTDALTRIKITGVRPKPEALTQDLQAKEGLNIDLGTRLSLRAKGFYVTQDGRLMSNEGEVRVGTAAGVRYTLRFGEVIWGEGMDVSAGEEGDKAAAETKPVKPGEQENRYLFVTANFDETLLGTKPTPPANYQPTSKPAATTQPAEGPQPESEPSAADKALAEKYEADLKEWEEKAEKGRKSAEDLNDRFAAWYYVIGGADFKNIRLTRDKLVMEDKDKEKNATVEE